METNKRKEFIEKFAVQVAGYRDIKKEFEEQTKKMQPTIGELADGYKSFISDLGEGFLQIAEDYNMCIEIAKQNELIGDVKLKARIKDFSSSRINSDKKVLDDVFGMEIVAPTEREKEILMLFNHLMFDISKDKKYNKPNGYVAYHCMGDFSPKDVNIKEWIKNTIEKSETREYKRSKDIPVYSSKRDMTPIFGKLQEIITDTDALNEIAKTFREMKEYMEIVDTNIALPVIETQFKTAEVAENALRGTAAHARYKPTDEEMIENKFKKGQLIRGINSPWKFEGTKEGLKLQDFYDTLMDNWPFLRKAIVERREAGKETKDRNISAQFDALTATQFPFLKKYIPQFSYDERKKQEIWVVLKLAMTANRLDENKPLEDEVLSLIIGNDIWQFDTDENDKKHGGASL